MKKILLLHILLITSIPLLLAQPSDFEFTPTNTFGGIFAIVEVDGFPATGYDWIAAFDENSSCAGAVQLTVYGDKIFCNLQVYGDDFTTVNVDEGINNGETFTFKLWDAATNEILDHPMDVTPVTGWNDGLNGTTVPGYDYEDEVVLNFSRVGPPPPDEDGDGFFGLVDPDDTDPCNPDNNVAVCDTDGDGMPDGSDPHPDCNGTLDECGVCNGTGFAAGTCDCDGTLPYTWYADSDSDGLGDPNNSTESCEQPAGFVSNAADNDDTIADVTDIDSTPENDGEAVSDADSDEDDSDAEAISIENVPTLSQWGLILLSLILLSITTVSIIQNKNSLAHNRGTVSSSSLLPYFDAALFRRILFKSIPVMLIIFVLISFLEDGWFIHNLVGTVLSVTIVVYLLHFIILSELFNTK